MTLCPTRTKPCDPSTKYQCANKQCVEKTQVCDFSNDCGDSSDELGCHRSKTCGLTDKGEIIFLFDFITVRFKNLFKKNIYGRWL